MRIFCRNAWGDWTLSQFFKTLPCIQGSNQSGPPLDLPDGTGVVHTSTISLSGFMLGQTLQQASELFSVSTNIEHSWMRDLEIKLSCPDGTSVILHNHPGNVGGEFFLDEPEEQDGNDPNPGIGYTYSWKPNTNLKTLLPKICSTA